jgi:hypothetical protein
MFQNLFQILFFENYFIYFRFAELLGWYRMAQSQHNECPELRKLEHLRKFIEEYPFVTQAPGLHCADRSVDETRTSAEVRLVLIQARQETGESGRQPAALPFPAVLGERA